MKIKKFDIKNIEGRKMRREVSPTNIMWSLVGGFMSIAIATVALSFCSESLSKSKLITSSQISQSIERGCNREAAQG